MESLNVVTKSADQHDIVLGGRKVAMIQRIERGVWAYAKVTDTENTIGTYEDCLDAASTDFNA